MRSVRKSEVPEFLKRGALYQALIENNDDPDEEFTFPASVLKLSESVDNKHDCDYLLDSLRFWGVDGVSNELIRYVLSSSSAENIDILKKYEQEFGFVRWVHLAITRPFFGNKELLNSHLMRVISLLRWDAWT